jgi:hypothetical protein
VELLVRAVALDREDILEARDILKALGYGRDITALLTRLGRRARPRPPTFKRHTQSALTWIERRRAEREAQR